MGRTSRRTAIGACLAAALLVAAPGGGAATAKDAPLQRGPAFQKRVDAAIAKGVAWLRTVQRRDGSFPDDASYVGAVTALSYYTLRACKVPAADPAAGTAFEAIRQAYAATRPKIRTSSVGELRTYTAALMCMALAEHGEPQAVADSSGERTYVLGDDDARWMKELVKYFEDTQDARGRWSYGYQATPDTSFDNSNTQYALLGLKAAGRAEIRAKSATWTKALQHFVDTQEPSGKPVPRDEPESDAKGRAAARPVDHARGWNYAKDPADVRLSMTAGGVGSVVICRSELLDDPKYLKFDSALDARAEKSARDGLAWMGIGLDDGYVFDVAFARDGGWSTWNSYGVYAVERAGVLAGVERVGKHDWYGEGAEFLTELQSANGSWGGQQPASKRKKTAVEPIPPSDVCVSTCFALLFLARGTQPVVRGSLTRALDDSDINFAVAPTLGDKDFDDFLDLVLSRWRRIDDAAVKERLFAKTTAVGRRIVVPLIQRLSSSKDEERVAALALLKRATGLDNGYDPSAKPDALDDAVAAWQSWWLANEKTLHFDAASGRLIP